VAAINAEKLLGDALPNVNIASVQDAASKLSDSMLHSCIIADDVDFGKSKQALLAVYLFTLLTDELSLQLHIATGLLNEQHPGVPEATGQTQSSSPAAKFVHRPLLLMVPPSLINQWILIRRYGPCDYTEYLDRIRREAAFLNLLGGR